MTPQSRGSWSPPDGAEAIERQFPSVADGCPLIGWLPWCLGDRRCALRGLVGDDLRQLGEVDTDKPCETGECPHVRKAAAVAPGVNGLPAATRSIDDRPGFKGGDQGRHGAFRGHDDIVQTSAQCVNRSVRGKFLRQENRTPVPKKGTKAGADPARSAFAKAIGLRIAAFRRDAGLTQESLWRGLNRSRGAVSAWENGAALPETESLPGLAKILGRSIDEILTGASAMPPESPPRTDGSLESRIARLEAGQRAIRAAILGLGEEPEEGRQETPATPATQKSGGAKPRAKPRQGKAV